MRNFKYFDYSIEERNGTRSKEITMDGVFRIEIWDNQDVIWKDLTGLGKDRVMSKVESLMALREAMDWIIGLEIEGNPDPKKAICPECRGTGEMEYQLWKEVTPGELSRVIGKMKCYKCQGKGELK